MSVDSEFKGMFYGPVNDTSSILGNMDNKLSVLFDEVN